MKVTTTMGDNSVWESTLSPARQLYWILPDDLLPPEYAPVRDSVPMTCQYRPEKNIPFLPKLQVFNFQLNRSDNEERDRLVWADTRNTWNTQAGKIRYPKYNAITGEGDPNDLPALELNIGMAGNVVAGTEMISDGTYGIKFGIPVLKIQVLDPSNLPSSISYFGNEHLVHHLMIIKSNIVNGQRQRNPFPTMGGRVVAPYLPSLTALISPVPLYIEMYKLKKLPLGSPIPNPYNPAWTPDWMW